MMFDGKYRLSAHAVITNEIGEILQLKQTYDDERWGLPGGALELGETIHEAVARECLEELGVPVIIKYMSGVYFHSRFYSHVFIFRCALPDNATLKLSHEHSQHRYFKLNELTSIQRRRVEDCLNFTGCVKSASF